MIDRILTVGGFTLLSRISGFVRDIILAAVLGAGPVADAFFVALRLPNHFRAIFAEGAFNAAFVPAYARIREEGGAARAGQFADRIFTLLLASQIVSAGGGAGVYASGDRCACAGLRTRSRPVCAGRRTHPYHIPLFAVDHARDALRRHPQRSATVCCRRRRSDPAQFVAHAGARVGGLLSDGRTRRRLGRARCRRARVPAGRGRCNTCRGAGTIPLAGTRRRRTEIFSRARAGNARFSRRAIGAVCRHDHRELPAGRRFVRALLCGPSQSAADRCHRHCGRHRHPSGNVPSYRWRRSQRRGTRAKSRDRIHVTVVNSVRRGIFRHSRSHHARIVHAWCIYGCRCRCGRTHA